MAQILSWDGVGERFYETGVNQGVLYPMDASGNYPLGVAWNGLVSVSENPTGAEPTNLYADNIKYLTLLSAEDLGLTIEAFTYPDEWNACDGSAEPQTGVALGQQGRAKFGLAFRTEVGNDVDGVDHGYKLHLVYGCQASPSEKAFNTINDSPEAITFSWEVSTVPEAVTGYKPTAIVTIDSRTADATKLAAFELILYGDDTGPTDPALPHVDAVITALTP